MDQDPIKFEHVGGLGEVKKLIRRRIITPLQKPSLIDRSRGQGGGAILLYGPRGCGKTLLARATAGECGAKFVGVASADLRDQDFDESARRLHATFAAARREAPALLFFDAIEALGGKRETSREAAAKPVGPFLAELDALAQNNPGVLILGATHLPWALDAAFRRPGRFDRALFVPPPDRAARKDILDKLLQQRRAPAPAIDTAALARRTGGFSGADLRQLIDSALDDTPDANGARPLTAQRVDTAVRAITPSTLEWLSAARNYARYANEGGQYDAVLEFLQQHAEFGRAHERVR